MRRLGDEPAYYAVQLQATVRTRVPRQAFGLALRHLMRRPTYDITPELLAKLSGVPKASILNGIDDRVAPQRSTSAIETVSDRLRLDDGGAELP